MQITVKKVKVIKTGTGDYGEWKLVGVETDDDKYTTFAKDAEKIMPGSVIEITDLNENEKGKSFKKYELISAPTPEETRAIQEEDKMTADMWAEKDRITKASIEGQNALTNLTQLTIAGIKLEDCPSLLRDALQSKIKGYMGESNTAPPKAKVKAPDIKDDYFPEDPPRAAAVKVAESTLIDMDELKGFIKRIWQYEKTGVSWIADKYKVKGGLLEDVVARLDNEQKKNLAEEIQDRLGML